MSFPVLRGNQQPSYNQTVMPEKCLSAFIAYRQVRNGTSAHTEMENLRLLQERALITIDEAHDVIRMHSLAAAFGVDASCVLAMENNYRQWQLHDHLDHQ